MPTTSTLLNLVNRTLLNIGERQITSFSQSDVARKAVSAVQDAIKDVANSYDWDFLTNKGLASSWNLDVATVNNVQRITNVKYTDVPGGGNRELTQLSIEQIDSMATTQTGYPMFYAIVGDGSVKVLPFPSGVTEQNKYTFYYVSDVPLPVNETDVIQFFPERYCQLITYRATFQLSMTLIDDKNSASVWGNLYQNLLAKTRARDGDNSKSYSNMFRYRGRY
jgi:hypothetical protein